MPPLQAGKRDLWFARSLWRLFPNPSQGYDTPEGYAIAKDGKMYCAFFTSANWKGEVELRGLKPGKYRVSGCSERKDLGTVDAAANGVAKRAAEFKDHLLLEVSSQP